MAKSIDFKVPGHKSKIKQILMVLYLVVLDLIADKLTFKALLELFSAGWLAMCPIVFTTQKHCSLSVTVQLKVLCTLIKNLILNEQFHICCDTKNINISLLFPDPKLALYG